MIAPYLRHLHRELSGSSVSNAGEEKTAAVPGSASISIGLEPMVASSVTGLPQRNDVDKETTAKSLLGAPGSASALSCLSLTQLREKVRETPRISEKKKHEGKWIPKSKEELIDDLEKIPAPGSASASTPPDTMTKIQRDAIRKQTEEYKAKAREREATRRQTDAYKQKERERYARRSQTDDYKAKEKERHAAPAYKEQQASARKVGRSHRRQVKFWEWALHQWRETIHADCMREVHRTYDAHQDETIANDELLEVTLPRVIDRTTAISDQPYALCFRCDGSIAIKQHGIINVLPNVDPPRGPKPQAESISAYRLALSLRCRLWGCFRGRCLLEYSSKDAFVGHSYRRFAQQFGYKCPMKDVSEEQLGSLSDRPPESTRRFLCNNQCPVNCCTTDCPWHDHEFELGASQDVSLQDPPPPGYELYTGVGEPVSDSLAVKPKRFQLICEHSRCTPIRLGARYAGFFDRIDRS